MDARKVYVAPTIAAEDVLEQTSLACNVTTLPGNGDETLIVTGKECETNIAKGGTFSGPPCTNSPGAEPVVLS